MGCVILELLFDAPGRYFMIIGLVIASIVLHELGHALTATWQGDPTPRMLGHLTWNPLKHMGWLSLGLVAVVGIGFGATPVQPRNFRNRRWGDVLVSFAGPCVNLLLAFASAGLLVALHRAGAESSGALSRFWEIALIYNVALFLFNMIPVPPFDGFSVLNGFVRLGDLKLWLERAHPWPMILAFVLVLRGPFWEVARALQVLFVRSWATVFALLG